MKFQSRLTRFFATLLFVSGFLSLWSTFCLAEPPPSLSEIQVAIDAESADWIAGPTAVSDVPLEQLCGAEIPPEDELQKAPPLLENAFPPDSPSMLDWRDYNGHDWTTPIRNQNPLGSCYIFATVAATEAAMKVQAGTYGYLADPDISEQFVVSCSSATSEAAVLNYLRDTGSTDEACFPYTASWTTPCTDRCSNWSDRIYQIESWGRPVEGWCTVAQIKTAIETYGPVASFIRVYNDFQSYRGGVYQHVSGTTWGGHTVTLVGWDDSQQCWIGKNSWGTDWGETIDFQPTTPGATNGGWFRIKWGECWIEYNNLYVVANMANLTDYPHTGWTYSLVPRNTTGTTWGSCPLPATLNGNSNTTRLNFAGINNGSETAPPFLSHFYVDDVYYWWASWPKIGAGGGFYGADLGPVTVKGGRHTLGVYVDFNNDVWESNETDYIYNYDNYESRQFVWSPYALSDNSPVTRSRAPKKDTFGYIYYNCDGFSFYVHDTHPTDWWSAVGVLPSNTSGDYDVSLHDIGTYTGSQGGFSTYLESSAYGGSVSDFVIVNDNMATAGTYYAGAINYNDGTGDFRIEEDTSEALSRQPGTQWNGPYNKNGYNILDIYEVYLYAETYYFLLDQTSGTCDLGMTLYDDSTVTARKADYMSGSYANSTGDGGDEAFQITIPDDGWYGLVVWKVDASDYAKSSIYRIAVGPPAITVTDPNGGQTWYIGGVNTITWDSFGASIGSYVKIEISRNNGSTWSTIISSTPNDGSYSWTVTGPVSTHCRIKVTSTSNSSYTDMSDANFTIASGALPCECDLNGDGSCNILDWPYFIEDWGRTDCNDPGVDCECDLNGDGACNILDWPYFIEDWGRTDCP